MQKAFRVRLHILSPVHIGCDEVYEPTGFVVDKGRKKLVAFDPVDFVRSLSDTDRKRFLAICEKGTIESIQELYRFMSGRSGVSGHEVAVSDGLLSLYAEKIGLPASKFRAELNKFSIGRTSFNPLDNSPYIPGSALKGALRTGWLNRLKKSGVVNINSRDRGAAKELEKQLLGGTFAADPFRLVKVSDLLPAGNPKTRICFAVNKKKKPSKHEARGPNQVLEVIEPGSVFEGVVTLFSPENGADIKKENAVSTSVEFFKQALAFFAGEVAGEDALLRKIGIPAETESKLKGRLPVRLGRHSGAEALTVEGVRSIKIMGKGREFSFNEHSTTIWLAAEAPKATAGLLPFGWAALEILPPDAATPYPVRIFADRAVPIAESAAGKTAKLEPPQTVVERIVWPSANLTWSPGNAVLTARFEGQKAELKLGGDRSIVPASLHKKLFEKKNAVTAKVTLERDGNLLKIVMLDT